MVQRPDNPSSGAQRPEFDRTVIRPAAQPAGGGTGPGPSNGSPEPAPAGKDPAGLRSSPVLVYAGFAALFLAVGAGVGGLAHLVASGAVSFSAPDTDGSEQPSAAQLVAGQPAASQDGAQKQSDIETADLAQTAPSDPPDPLAQQASLDELDEPADPFFDMALSAVIPLAGDPVLLKSGSAAQRLDLSERPVPEKASSSGVSALPTLTAYVLDSRMLNADGDLVIRAPGSEADFQFGNFGGGEETDSLEVEDGAGTVDAGKPDLPVFLKPPTDTLNLFLTERPIGQGPSRIELTQEIAAPVTLSAFLKDNGFDEEASRGLVAFAKEEFKKTDLVAGDRIALRGARMANRVGRIGDYYRPVQMSVYSVDGYLGTAAYSVSRDGEAYVNGADPWFGKTIAGEKDADDNNASGGRSHRLIDGLYATAVRNAVPASIVGEAIAYLAPSTDLKRPIKPDERFTLVFTDQPRDEKRGGGRVLFAGVRRGDDWSVRCYVLKAPGNRGFACVSEGGKISLSGAMLVPVKGVLTSKFGMRFHPIKKTERLHAGVDWAAPTGTPIRAAFSGKVTYKDVRGGYGNFIELTHKDGITSRYAHMHEYADGIELGSVVQAGDLIGYVGTTGLSTGPHLHFEIRQRGEPTDPLAFEMETGTAAPQSVASKDLKTYRTTIGEILTTH